MKAILSKTSLPGDAYCVFCEYAEKRVFGVRVIALDFIAAVIAVVGLM
jgi:hypothetical protein